LQDELDDIAFCGFASPVECASKLSQWLQEGDPLDDRTLSWLWEWAMS